MIPHAIRVQAVPLVAQAAQMESIYLHHPHVPPAMVVVALVRLVVRVPAPHVVDLAIY